MGKLNPGFMAEIFKLMFSDEVIMRIASEYLKYELIPKEWVGYKFILREAIIQYTEKNKLPSIGVICQKLCDEDAVQLAAKEIKKAALIDREIAIDQLQSFVKETEFELLSRKVHDLYEEGKKEEAIRVNAEESQRILEMSFRSKSGGFQSVFGGFHERMVERRMEGDAASEKPVKVPFGVDRLDDVSFGGMEIGDTSLWIARSGVGKSSILKWHGYSAAIRGVPVLHIQLEGGIKACMQIYDQLWSAQSYSDIKSGNISPKDRKKIEQAIKEVKELSSDIEVYGFKKFGQASMGDVRQLCYDYFNTHGKFPGLVILDSLDLVKTGISKKIDSDPDHKKEKLQTCAQLLKNLADEIGAPIITATQTSDVPFEVWNNPDKVIDRSYTEGDKTLVKPFSFVFTLNMTIEEKANATARIYVDKLRDYKESQEVITIATNYDKRRFYHRGRTMEMYNQISERKEIKKQARKKKTEADKMESI
jgi:replicative DNA helicase|nr:MAG TPA: DnaB-like replicative helicase [Bacteriophage sp.]